MWVRGEIPDLPAVAIVGTRAPSDEALAFTRALAAALARAGVAVWSGGAAGIDAAAHEAALDAGGVTVLVSGGGLDRPYPRDHAALFERVLAQGGALVARVPDGTPPMAPLFLARNEVLAALSQATVVVEAGLQSGARSTAAAARRLGRALCVVPGAPWNPRGAGCALELARGARAITCAAEVLDALGRPPPAPAPRKPRKKKKAAAPSEALPLPACSPPTEPPLDAAETAIMDVIGPTPIHVDEVCEAADLPGSAALGALLTLTLRAVVVEGPAGFFRRASGSDGLRGRGSG